MDTAYKTTLELDKVLNRAVQLCACQETKEMMQALEPAPTIEDERYDLTQTNAINALLIKNGSPRFGSVREVRRIVAHARKGGILSMGELLEIAATLRNFSGLSQWYGLSEHEMLPTDDLFFALAPQPVLEKQISESIISPEEMADTASVTLHDLRRKIRQTEDSIRDMVQFFTCVTHGFILWIFSEQQQFVFFRIILNTLQGGFITNQDSGNFTIIHHFLFSDEHNIPVIDSGPDHGITLGLQAEISMNVCTSFHIQFLFFVGKNRGSTSNVPK